MPDTNKYTWKTAINFHSFKVKKHCSIEDSSNKTRMCCGNMTFTILPEIFTTSISKQLHYVTEKTITMSWNRQKRWLQTDDKWLKWPIITFICSSIAVATLVCMSTRRFFSRSSGRELWIKKTFVDNSETTVVILKKTLNSTINQFSKKCWWWR